MRNMADRAQTQSVAGQRSGIRLPAGQNVPVQALRSLLSRRDQEIEALRAELQAMKESMARAGAVGIARRMVDGDQMVVAVGRGDIVVTIADRNVTYNVGDLVQTDVQRTLAVANLGSGSLHASNIVEYLSTNPGDTVTVRANGETRVYVVAGELRNGACTSLEPGDLLLADNDTGFAYCVHSNTECRDYTKDLPPLVYAGTRDVLGQIEATLIDPLFEESARRTAGMLVILAGPSGSGKSHVVKALAQRRGVVLVRVTGDEVSSSYVSETGRAIRETFSRAIDRARKGAKTLVAVEEANVITGRRYGFRFQDAASREFGNITSAMLLQIDRLVDLGPELPIAVCFTTNLIAELDAAVRSRAAAEIIVGYIDRIYGRELLTAHLVDSGIALAGGDQDLDRMVDLLFDTATPLVRVDAEIGQTRQRFELTASAVMLPRLLAGVASDLRRQQSPVSWAEVASAIHGRLLAHARQIADAPTHYVPYASHPFAGDADVRIAGASAVYPTEAPREILHTI